MMGKRGKKQHFSNVWATQTQLGKHFSLSAREVGLKLNELGLRTYDPELHKYIPAQAAIVNGLCTFTPLQHGVPFYMWQIQKVTSLLQEKLQIVPLSDADIEYREIALYLIEVEKGTNEDYDKMYYLFFETIPHEDLPAIIAWSLIEAHKSADPVYQRLVNGIAAEDFGTINNHLERLCSPLRLCHQSD